MGTRAGENGVSGRTGILRCDVREESSTSHENEGLGLVHRAPVAPLAGTQREKSRHAMGAGRGACTAARGRISRRGWRVPVASSSLQASPPPSPASSGPRRALHSESAGLSGVTLSTPSAPEEPLAEALLELPPPAPPPPPVAPLDRVPPPLDILVPLRSEPRSLRPSGYGYRTHCTMLSTALARLV